MKSIIMMSVCGPECTGMDRNAPEWVSITGMDIKINLFCANKFIFHHNLSWNVSF